MCGLISPSGYLLSPLNSNSEPKNERCETLEEKWFLYSSTRKIIQLLSLVSLSLRSERFFFLVLVDRGGVFQVASILFLLVLLCTFFFCADRIPEDEKAIRFFFC